jgi:nitroreductase/NAD-dependent dihydropyrimidine dehydrogenase PreA subunit
MSQISIDQTRCIKCGLCVAVCPRGLIQFSPDWPKLENSALCIACGQCVAVCPTTALDNVRAPLALQSPLPAFPVLDGEKARQFLRSRRSIRCYLPNRVPHNKLLQLMNIARFAPSGGNSQGISYLVIDRPERLRQLTEHTIAWMESPAQEKSPAAKIYAQYVSMYRKSARDSILRDAPALVLGTAAATFARGRENTILALAYVELYASSIGLGTCWAGMLEAAAFSGFAPLLELLGIPDGKQFTGALMVGYPKVSFQRLVDRNPLELTFQDA